MRTCVPSQDPRICGKKQLPLDREGGEAVLRDNQVLEQEVEMNILKMKLIKEGFFFFL